MAMVDHSWPWFTVVYNEWQCLTLFEFVWPYFIAIDIVQTWFTMFNMWLNMDVNGSSNLSCLPIDDCGWPWLIMMSMVTMFDHVQRCDHGWTWLTMSITLRIIKSGWTMFDLSWPWLAKLFLLYHGWLLVTKDDHGLLWVNIWLTNFVHYWLWLTMIDDRWRGSTMVYNGKWWKTMVEKVNEDWSWLTKG